MAAIRFGIGALCLMPFLVIGVRRKPIVQADWPAVIFLGALFFDCSPFCSMRLLPPYTAAHGAVGLATSPIITLVLAWILAARL